MRLLNRNPAFVPRNLSKPEDNIPKSPTLTIQARFASNPSVIREPFKLMLSIKLIRRPQNKKGEKGTTGVLSKPGLRI